MCVYSPAHLFLTLIINKQMVNVGNCGNSAIKKVYYTIHIVTGIINV